MNPYNPCTAKEVIDDKQCTIVWHMDDLKISHHKDPEVLTNIIKDLNRKFDVESSLIETFCGKIHDLFVGSWMHNNVVHI